MAALGLVGVLFLAVFPTQAYLDQRRHRDDLAGPGRDPGRHQPGPPAAGGRARLRPTRSSAWPASTTSWSSRARRPTSSFPTASPPTTAAAPAPAGARPSDRDLGGPGLGPAFVDLLSPRIVGPWPRSGWGQAAGRTPSGWAASTPTARRRPACSTSTAAGSRPSRPTPPTAGCPRRRPSSSWRTQVPPGFCFAPKAHLGITHRRDLEGIEDRFAAFLAAVAPLGSTTSDRCSSAFPTRTPTSTASTGCWPPSRRRPTAPVAAFELGPNWYTSEVMKPPRGPRRHPRGGRQRRRAQRAGAAHGGTDGLRPPPPRALRPGRPRGVGREAGQGAAPTDATPTST